MTLEVTVLLFLFIFLSLGMSGIAFTFKKIALGYLASLGWVICMMFTYFEATFETTLYQAVMVFFLCAFLVTLAVSVRLNTKPTESIKPLSYRERMQSNLQRYRELRRRL